MNLQKIKDDLEQLLYKVGEIARNGYEDREKQVVTKLNANDLLTKYDTQVNTLIIEYLEKNYPDISIISEEAPAIHKDSDYAFVVDPIDGTRNFVRGIPMFFCGIGLVKNNRTVLSITYNPILDEMFYAIKGEGSYRNGKKIRVSQTAELMLSDICIRTFPDKSFEKQVVTEFVEQVFQVKNNMSSHEEIAGVSCGRYDGVISKGSSPRDYCHYLLVQEAGGKVTDRKGDEFDISKNNIIVSNGVIHDQLLSKVLQIY